MSKGVFEIKLHSGVKDLFYSLPEILSEPARSGFFRMTTVRSMFGNVFLQITLAAVSSECRDSYFF